MLIRQSSFLLFALGAAVAACGGAIAVDPTDAGVTDAKGPPGPDSDAQPPPPAPGTPPAKPPGPATAVPSTKTFAIQRIYLGEASRTGAASDTAWKQFGYNLDGKVTAGTSTDVCTRAKGSPSSNQADGTDGIDNAFGAVILPLIRSAASQLEPSKTASLAYQNGTMTTEISITGLDGSPSQTATGLGGGLFPALGYSGDGPAVPFPGFAPTTDWPVRVEGLQDGATIAGGAKASLAGSWIASGIFVSGGPSLDVTVSYPLGALSVPLVLHHAIVTLDTHGRGTFAGIADTEEFIVAMRKVAGAISTSLCGLQFDGIAQQIRQAADIMKDGTNVAGTSCNGFSVGIGFDAAPIANPTKVAKNPLPTAPDPCK